MPFLSFCYEVCLTLSGVQAANANCESFAVTFLLLRPSSPNPNGFCFAELSTNLLVALSNLGQAHHRCIVGRTLICFILLEVFGQHSSFRTILFPNTSMVDLGGFAPPSRTLFSLLHTAITYIIYLFDLFVKFFDSHFNQTVYTVNQWYVFIVCFFHC